MFWPYALLWIPMIVIAVANGVIRETTYGRRVSEPSAHRLSTLIAILLLSVYVWLVMRLWPLQSVDHAIAVGALWLVLTAAFEFLFGHFVLKHPWRALAEDWNLFRGRLWPLVPIWLAFAPYVFYRL